MKKRIPFQQVLALICAISMLLPMCSALGLQLNLSADEIKAGNKNDNMVVTDGVYTVATEGQWGIYVLGESESWEVTMTLTNNAYNAEYGLQICGADDDGDGLILEGNDSFLQVFLTGNEVIRLIGCDKSWGNVEGYKWDNINRSTGLGNKDELTLTVKLDGNNLSYFVGDEQCGETIVLDDKVMYGNVVTLFMKHTDTSISNVTYIDRTVKCDEHTYGSTWYYTTDNHWQKCTQCGSTTARTTHTYDSETDEICNVCGQETRHVNHTASTEWSWNSTSHWHECTKCGIAIDRTTHTYDSATDEICNVCGQETRHANHIASSEWTWNTANHWHKCTLCNQKLNIEKHTFNDEGVCTVCRAKAGYIIKDGVKTVFANGANDGEASWEADDIATVTKKYFAVSFTMNAAEHAGILADNGTCGLMFGDNDDNCVFIPYDGGNTDTQHTIGIYESVYAIFGPWWTEPDFGTNNRVDISKYVNKNVTILVLGEKNDDGTTTFSAYINGEQVTV